MSDNGPGEDENKRTVKLARIHNQRRSRVLRKEHLNELEAKVCKCRQIEAEASRKLQTAGSACPLFQLYL
ncbi:hypothetical protein LTR49_028738 [Elasticomyces elasticus]|nr:hypothetical protein LTR49_028738 [Elasticomyces elasticus]